MQEETDNQLPRGFVRRTTLSERDPDKGVEVVSLAWCPHGQRIATLHIGAPPSIWDLENNSSIAVLTSGTVKVNDLEWSPDGGTLALACADGTIQVFDATSGKLNQVIHAASIEVRHLSWSPDGKILASCPTESSAVSMGLWDPQTGAPLRSPWAKDFPFTVARSTSMGLDPDLHRPSLAERAKSKERVVTTAWSPDGQFFAAGCENGAIGLWSNSPSEDPLLIGHSLAISKLAWSSDGRVASLSSDGLIVIWDAETRKKVRRIEVPNTQLTIISFSTDDELLASLSAEGVVRVWRCDTWQLVSTLTCRASQSNSLNLAFHPTQPVLATPDQKENGVVIWDLDLNAICPPTKERILAASVADQATANDALGFAPYVEALYKFLTHPSTTAPLTLSIEGGWGSGKSSLMLQLESKIKGDSLATRLKDALKNKGMKSADGESLWARFRRAIRSRRQFTIQFNAWRHDKEDAMWAAFALEFIRQISKQRFVVRQWWGHLLLFVYRFRWKDGWLESLRALGLFLAMTCAAAVIPVLAVRKGPEWAGTIVNLGVEDFWHSLIKWLIAAGATAASLTAVLAAWLKIKEVIGSPFQINLSKYVESPDYQKRVAFIEDFHRDFEKIVKAYSSGKGKVYVFIDDMDRCEVPKAADLMQALNLMIGSNPNLIFLIGMDREKVAAGLAVKYEKLLPYLNPSSRTARDSVTGNEKSDPLKGLEYGYAFIEKFIQLPFRVPKPTNKDLNEFLDRLCIAPSPKKTGRLLSLRFPRFRARKTFRTSRLTESDQALAPTTTGEADRLPSESNVAQPPSQAGMHGRSSTRQVEKRRRLNFELEGDGEDSKLFRETVLSIASALDDNPRRIKQFVNLFRLRAHIAEETGLFHIVEGKPLIRRLTLQKLGKFVALSLKCPLLLNDLDEDPKLLATLQRQALQDVLPETIRDERLNEELRGLLRIGCVDVTEQRDFDKEQVWSLARMDVEDLLRVSPAVERPRPVLTPEEKTKSRSDSAQRSESATTPVPDLIPVQPESKVGAEATPPKEATSAGLLLSLLSRVAESEQSIDGENISMKDTKEVGSDTNAPNYDVFLAHRLEGVSDVEFIAERLREMGLKPWFVTWDLPPGGVFDDYPMPTPELFGALVVFVDRGGIGPWDEAEFRTVVDHFVEKKRPVIPTLLSQLVSTSDVPQFLRRFGVVQFNGPYDAEALDRLIRGITRNRAEADYA